ncbi:MAG: VWA domain-containing protein [Ignavibacteria bacterium]|nr:VWA domain-containing protein [Ignavibacteria bacterium]
MFTFQNVHYFWGFILIAILFVVFIILRIFREKAIQKFGNQHLIYSLMEDYSPIKPYVKFGLVALALTFIILTLANPIVGTKLIEGKRKGVDIVIALDVSNSMKAEDIKPNRLERAKKMIMKLIDNLVNDRIGIIVFAGEAFIQLPLTTDYSAAKLFTTNIDTDIVPTQGTAIGSAIDLAIEHFSFDEKRKKALIIISDGENHEDDAISSAKNAVRHNFVIHTIGMGTLTGGPIPIVVNGTKMFLKDKYGSVVTSKVDPMMLERIASIGNGEFILNSGIDPDLNEIVDKIAKMEKQEFETKIFSHFESQYQYTLIPALLLILIELILSERRSKILLALNSFVIKNK